MGQGIGSNLGLGLAIEEEGPILDTDLIIDILFGIDISCASKGGANGLQFHQLLANGELLLYGYGQVVLDVNAVLHYLVLVGSGSQSDIELNGSVARKVKEGL
jgi:hypothetical protein